MRVLKAGLALMIACLFPSASFADATSFDAFFAATAGNWSGTGSVAIKLGVPKKYAIKVTQTSAQTEPNLWSFTSSTIGTPHSGGTTLTQYQINGDQLLVISTQYSVQAEIAKTSATELSFQTTHVDPVTGHSVTVSREMTLVAADSLHVLSDIYQDQSLVQHFDYVLKRN